MYKPQVSHNQTAKRGTTYHRPLLAGSIGHRDERNVKVVEVHFTSCLKLVKEVEETECEGSAGASQSRWKPMSAKKLITTGDRFCPGFATETVHDSYCVDTRDVEQRKCYGVGGEGTGVANVMAKLM